MAILVRFWCGSFYIIKQTGYYMMVLFIMVEKVDYVSVMDSDDQMGTYLTLDGERIKEGDVIQIASLEHPNGLTTKVAYGNPKDHPANGWYFESAPGIAPEGVFARWM